MSTNELNIRDVKFEFDIFLMHMKSNLHQQRKDDSYKYDDLYFQCQSNEHIKVYDAYCSFSLPNTSSRAHNSIYSLTTTPSLSVYPNTHMNIYDKYDYIDVDLYLKDNDYQFQIDLIYNSDDLLYNSQLSLFNELIVPYGINQLNLYVYKLKERIFIYNQHQDITGKSFQDIFGVEI